MPQNAFMGVAHGSNLSGFENYDHGGKHFNESDLAGCIMPMGFWS